jgi:hypothetical protein
MEAVVRLPKTLVLVAAYLQGCLEKTDPNIAGLDLDVVAMIAWSPSPGYTRPACRTCGASPFLQRVTGGQKSVREGHRRHEVPSINGSSPLRVPSCAIDFWLVPPLDALAASGCFSV